MKTLYNEGIILDYALYLHIFVTIFSILNPLGSIPIFLGITLDENPDEKKKTIKKTVMAVIIILLASAYLGNYILDFFGIDINTFKTAGGILLLLMSIHMLQAKTPPSKTNTPEHAEAIAKEDVSVVPLAIPLIAGPGTISTVILFASEMHTVVDKVALGIIIVLVSSLILPILLLSKPIGRYLGTTGLNVATRIMGLILASLAVKFILEGVLAFLKANA